MRLIIPPVEARTVINIQAPIGKTVGKRRPPRDALVAGLRGQAASNERLRVFGHQLAPEGVFRFSTFQEAERWKMKFVVGEVAQCTVVRVNDGFTVVLSHTVSGIDFAQAEEEIVFREIDGVQIPLASPRLLWRMKRTTHRLKDQGDPYFLRPQFPGVAFD